MTATISMGKAPNVAESAARMQVRLPDFMIIGAAKSGTTTLFEYLVRHPGVFMSTPKEPEFFSNDSAYALGEKWYGSLFAEAQEHQICGEASTTYSRWPHTPDVPGRIAGYAAHQKFIYIMRHPVERAYSHYKHHMRHGVTMTFEEALQRDSIYVDCSLYIQQIGRYLRFFKPDSFLFLTLDELATDLRGTLRKVQRFLGLQELDLVRESAIFANSNTDEVLRFGLRRRFSRVPALLTLMQSVPRPLRHQVLRIVKSLPIGSRILEEMKTPAMLAETRFRLLNVFEAFNRELEQFLDWDLGGWYE